LNKNPPKKNEVKKGKQEKPVRPIYWEGMPQPEPDHTEKNVFEIHD
jgi:hypothetical protein